MIPLGNNFHRDSFCTQLWMNVVVQPAGEFKICCLANDNTDSGVAKDDNGNVMHILTHSFLDAVNSVAFRRHRLELSNNIQPEKCRNCYQIEKANGRSIRQARNDFHLSDPKIITVNNATSVTSNDGSTTLLPIALDLRLGNLCNYKCVMCSPKYSSSWESEWEAATGRTDANLSIGDDLSVPYQLIKTVKNKIQLKNANSWWESDKWWKHFEEVAHVVRYLHFTGGEPLLVPAHREVLERLIARGRAHEVELRYHTNLSVVNTPLFNLIKQFKSVSLSVSVDDIDDRYHLIRNPGQFDQLLRNLYKLQKIGIRPVDLNGCIGVSTIYAPFRLVPLSRKLNLSYYWRFLYGPEEQSLIFLPDSAKKEIIDVYESSTIDLGPVNQSVTAFLRMHMNKHNPHFIKRYVQFMNRLDNIRGVSWRETLHDVYDLLQRHCPAAFEN